MSGRGERFQTPSFQPADAAICLWHEKKEKTEPPSPEKGWAQSPFFLPQPVQGSGRESAERDSGPHVPAPPCTEAGGEHAARRRQSANLFLASSCREDGFLHKGEERKRWLPHRDDLAAEQQSVSPAVPDKGLRCPASDPGKGLPDPWSRCP